MILSCFSANSLEMCISSQRPLSMPTGFRVDGTLTFAPPAAMSSRYFRPPSPMVLYDAPDRCADVMSMRSSAP